MNINTDLEYIKDLSKKLSTEELEKLLDILNEVIDERDYQDEYETFLEVVKYHSWFKGLPDIKKMVNNLSDKITSIKYDKVKARDVWEDFVELSFVLDEVVVPKNIVLWD